MILLRAFLFLSDGHYAYKATQRALGMEHDRNGNTTATAAIAEDAAGRRGAKEKVQIPEGYATIRRKIRIDPTKYRSANYIPLGENDDPKKVQMPSGIVGMEMLTEETASDLGDATEGNPAPSKTAQDSLAEALMSIVQDAEIHVAEEKERIKEQSPDYGDTHYVAPAEVPPPITEDACLCVALDAKGTSRPKIRCKTTFKNCKARNPLYCPYHGAAIIQKDLEGQLRNMGLTGIVEVDNGEENGEFFYISVSVPTADKDKAAQMLDVFMKTPGIKQSVDTDETNVDAGMTQFAAYFDVDVLRSDLPPDEQDKGKDDGDDESETGGDGKEQGGEKDDSTRKDESPQSQKDKDIGEMRNAIDGLVANAKSLYELSAKYALDNESKEADDIAEDAAQFSMRMQDISETFAEMVEKKNEEMKQSPDSVKGLATAHVLDLMMKTFKEKTIPRATKERDDIGNRLKQLIAGKEAADVAKARDRIRESFAQAMEETRHKVFESANGAGITPIGFSPEDLESALSDAFKTATAGMDKEKADKILSAYVTADGKEEFRESADELEEARLAVDNLDSITEHMDRDALRQYGYDMLGYVRAYSDAAVSLIHGYEKAIKKAGLETKRDTEIGEARAMALDDAISYALAHADPQESKDYLDTIFTGSKTIGKRLRSGLPQDKKDTYNFNAIAIHEMLKRFPNIEEVAKGVEFSLRKPSGRARAEVTTYQTWFMGQLISSRNDIRTPYSKRDKFGKDAGEGRRHIPWGTNEEATSLNVSNVAVMMHEIGHLFYHHGRNAVRWEDMLSGMKDKSWEYRVSGYVNDQKPMKRRNELHSECMALYTMPTYKKGTLPKEVEEYMADILGEK